MKKITRGSIFYAKLDHIMGSEQKGYRPVVILQNDMDNMNSTTIMIAPIITKNYIGKILPNHVKVKQFKNLRPNSIILLDQIRTIDKSKLSGFVATLDEKQVEKVEKALLISFGFSNEYLMKYKHNF